MHYYIWDFVLQFSSLAGVLITLSIIAYSTWVIIFWINDTAKRMIQSIDIRVDEPKEETRIKM